MMSCQSYRIEIEEMEASTRPGGELASHLSACEACRAFYSEQLALRRLVGEMEAVAAPADFDFRLRARLAANGGAGNHRSSWRSFVFSAPAIGLAASLALLAVAATAFYNRSKPVTTTVANSPAEVVRQQASQTNSTETVTPRVQTATRKTSPEAIREKNESPLVASTPNTTRQPRMANGKVNPPRKLTPAPSRNLQSFSNDIAATGAPVITPYGGNTSPVVGGSPLVEVSVRSKSQPLKIHLDDRSGVKRTVTLEPVIFGSQDLAGRESSRAANSKGIW